MRRLFKWDSLSQVLSDSQLLNIWQQCYQIVELI